METCMDIRYGANPKDFARYTTEEIRSEFLLDKLFVSGGITVTYSHIDRMMVLGRMTARVDALPALGEEHVVVGLDRGSEGRKTWTAATLYDSGGRVVARAEHTWVAVNPTAFA